MRASCSVKKKFGDIFQNESTITVVITVVGLLIKMIGKYRVFSSIFCLDRCSLKKKFNSDSVSHCRVFSVHRSVFQSIPFFDLTARFLQT